MQTVDRLSQYRFKLAETCQEQDEINRLLYRAFVVEIPRYTAAPGADYLVDRFHYKNRYIMALRDGRICGVVAVHDQPPFSVAETLANPQILEPLRPGPLEVRLLTVEPAERCGPVFGGLMWSTFEHARSGGYRFVVISGLADRRRMYEHMGFRSLGPAVRRGQTDFIPMSFDLADVPADVQRYLDRLRERIVSGLNSANHA